MPMYSCCYGHKFADPKEMDGTLVCPVCFSPSWSVTYFGY